MPSRRELLAGAAAFGSSLVLPATWVGSASAATNLILKEAGGLSGEAVKKAFVDPFTAKTGVQVTQESPSTNVGFLKTMVRSGTFSVHVFEVGDSDLPTMKAEDLLEPLDWAQINPDPTNDEAIDSHGLAWSYYSTVMAWRSDQKPLESWVDFWDVEKFPGARSLIDEAPFVVAHALLGDGVAMENLFPLDIDRAFASLERIKPHVLVWWSSGAQPVQLLRDNEVQYASVWNGRVHGQSGIDYTFNQGQLNSSYFSLPKGLSPDLKEQAFQFLHEVTVAENQAIYASMIPYTGPSKDLNKFLPAESLSSYPTSPENRKVQFLTDTVWWTENKEEVEERWVKFKLSL